MSTVLQELIYLYGSPIKVITADEWMKIEAYGTYEMEYKKWVSMEL